MRYKKEKEDSSGGYRPGGGTLRGDLFCAGRAGQRGLSICFGGAEKDEMMDVL